MKHFYFRLSLIFTLLFVLQDSWGQGVTTSSLTGSVTDAKSDGLPGATVVAIHTPSGTRYGTSTLTDGRFTIPNMRVGGPYAITISFIGFQDQIFNNVNLGLGVASTIQVKMLEQSGQLNEVVVTSTGGDVLSPERTGAATNVGRETIQSIPTISRGLRDFTKLSPLANTNASGTSFAGTSNRYNQFAIDGIVNNDVFGLSGSGTNGGQIGIEPISLDAIEEFQINIAPFDVRQGGFTGGGINAVTRSGTNTFQGSAYYFGNNEKFVSPYNPNTEEKADYPAYKDFQTGFRLGGPIIKNKLFFFANGEVTKSTTPLAFDPTISGSGSQIPMDAINRVLATLRRIAPSYDPGSYGAIDDELNSRKFLAKIDWNISQKHRLSLRHSYAYGENIDNSRGNNSLNFYNNGQYFPSTTNSSALELNSVFGSKFSNNLLLGYTAVRDDRDPLGDPFPNVRIYLDGGANIQLGSEFSSVANVLNQDILSLTDNFSYYKGKHTFTLGTHNEFYKFYNQFVQNIYGGYGYKTLAGFESIGTAAEVSPSYYAKSYSFDTSDDPGQTKGAAKFSAMQLGLYIQDEYQATDNVKVTVGVRADLPVFNDQPANNPAFATAYASRGISTDQIPDVKVLWSPRAGFNWDVLGDNSLKVRGGTGLFTGRAPFVWISNQYTNTGTVIGTYSLGRLSSSENPITTPAGLKFSADPYNQPTAATFGGNAAIGAINITDTNYKFPQTWRTNIGIDKTLPYGLVATLEGIYSKGYNNIIFENLNRAIDPNFTFDGADKRPRYLSNRINSAFDEIILFSNSNKGYTYNLVAQLQKQMADNWAGSVSYTYGSAQDIFPATSSTAYSNWRNLYNVNGPNAPVAGIANFDTQHRISGYVTYRKEYLKNFATQVSLFYNGQTGQPVSYIYNGDLNNDGTTNDLIYVPSNSSEINLVQPASGSPSVEDQWKALDAFISADEYLNSRRGQYVERNGGRLPFQHQFDIRVLQDLGISLGNTSNKLQLSFDLINLGNLLNKEWGADYTTSFNSFSLINYTGQADKTGADAQKPTFTYTGAGQNNGKVYTESNFNSRWRGQFGIRYIFN
jgi:hypothetical protein